MKYNKDAPLDETKPAVKKVMIMLNQHIGAPASPIVKENDVVKAGQMIAVPAKGLSVAIHASIDGTVTKVADKFIIIEA